ncbi:MAG: hypothetical protein R3B96_20410 [Pirellulaceae bacterium]
MKRSLWQFLAVACLGVNGLALTHAQAQEAADLLGIGQVLSDANAASLVDLTEDQMGQVEQWRQTRMQAASDLLGGDLPEDIAARIDAINEFVMQSETELGRLLTPEQAQLLELIVAAQEGVNGLSDDAVADKLLLTAEQQQSIDELLETRAADLEADPGVNLNVIDARYGLRLQRILSPSQLAAWRVLSLEVSGDLPEIEAPTTEEVAETPTRTTPPVTETPATDGPI